MNDLITRALRFRKVTIGRDFYQARQIRKSRITFGNRFADWTFCPDTLGENAVVYSFGVGEDISFDLKLMETYNLKVHAFDPSPGSIQWIKKQSLPQGFKFFPYGLAGQDGTISFTEPADPGIHSLRITDGQGENITTTKTHHLPVHSLPTIVKNLGHERIDILKMDIEGAEYEVIQDIITATIPISQVLIEFHHRFENIGIQKTRDAIALLNEAGFLIFNVSASGEEISFIKA